MGFPLHNVFDVIAVRPYLRRKHRGEKDNSINPASVGRTMVRPYLRRKHRGENGYFLPKDL